MNKMQIFSAFFAMICNEWYLAAAFVELFKKKFTKNRGKPLAPGLNSNDILRLSKKQFKERIWIKMKSYLQGLGGPGDLKKMTLEDLPALAEEIRQALITKVTATGGHMASNLGMVEATIALHYVFDSPIDKLVFDVSHQSYTHKMLTGRKEAFLEPEKYHSVTGYTNPLESPHDFFTVGHTSTAVSLAVGMAKSRDLQGKTGNVIAIVGDGSLSGGEAFEGLNNAAELGSNLIIVFNDNEMSIAVNQGGMYRNFAQLRETKGQADCNFFKAFGLDYLYVEDGNDIAQLTAAFQQVKDSPRPVVVHIHTQKGKGLAWAEEDKESGHWTYPSVPEGEEVPQPELYETITADFLLEKIRRDKKVVVISPATPGATGLTKEFRLQAGKQFVDVGIAEEHAVAFASGLAKSGCKPVLEINSSFVQRTYDQLSQDLALNQSPAVILIFSNGISGADSTHLGVFDIPMMSSIPHLVCLAPTVKEEYLAMLDWAIEQQEHPVVIRVPEQVVSTGKPCVYDSAQVGRYQVCLEGSRVAILGLGSFFSLAEQAADVLREKAGVEATLINPRGYTQLDKETLERLKENHQLVVTLEDGVMDGGFGEKVARYYGPSDVKTLAFGGEKEFTDRVPLKELYQRYHLNPEQIAEDISKAL